MKDAFVKMNQISILIRETAKKFQKNFNDQFCAQCVLTSPQKDSFSPFTYIVFLF